MTTSGILLILVFIAVVAALAAPLGAYMAKVFAGERTWAHRADVGQVGNLRAVGNRAAAQSRETR